MQGPKNKILSTEWRSAWQNKNYIHPRSKGPYASKMMWSTTSYNQGNIPHTKPRRYIARTEPTWSIMDFCAVALWAVSRYLYFAIVVLHCAQSTVIRKSTLDLQLVQLPVFENTDSQLVKILIISEERRYSLSLFCKSFSNSIDIGFWDIQESAQYLSTSDSAFTT